MSLCSTLLSQSNQIWFLSVVNPIALRMAKTPQSFGYSKGNSVKQGCPVIYLKGYVRPKNYAVLRLKHGTVQYTYHDESCLYP